MNDKVKTINIDGIEVQTSLTPVELADLPQKYAELQSNWNSLREWINEFLKSNDKWYKNELSYHDKMYYNEIYTNTEAMLKKFLDKMNELEGKDKE